MVNISDKHFIIVTKKYVAISKAGNKPAEQSYEKTNYNKFLVFHLHNF